MECEYYIAPLHGIYSEALFALTYMMLSALYVIINCYAVCIFSDSKKVQQIGLDGIMLNLQLVLKLLLFFHQF